MIQSPRRDGQKWLKVFGCFMVQNAKLSLIGYCDTGFKIFLYLYLVPKKINWRHLLPAVCVSHDGKLYVWTEPCFKDASYQILPGPLLLTPSSMAYWELWSFVSRHFCILFMLYLEFLSTGLLTSRSEIKWVFVLKSIFFSIILTRS